MLGVKGGRASFNIRLGGRMILLITVVDVKKWICCLGEETNVLFRCRKEYVVYVQKRICCFVQKRICCFVQKRICCLCAEKNLLFMCKKNLLFRCRKESVVLCRIGFIV